MDIEVAIGVGLTLLLMFFAATHMAVRTFSRIRLAQMLEARNRSEWMDRLLETRTDLTLAAAVLRTSSAVGLMLVVMRQLDPDGTTPWSVRHSAALFAITVSVVLVFGVAIPNAWARYAGEALLARVLPLLHTLRLALWPVVKGLGFFDEIVRRLAGAPRHEDTAEAERIEQELLKAVSEGEKRGALDVEEKEMIEAVMELRDTHAGQIMTPRTEIIGVPVDTSFEQVKALIVREGHSRLPVFQDTIDNVLGVLYAKDLLGVENAASFTVQAEMRQVPFVPESKLLRDLLHEFQETKVQMAVVLDEYGGTAGLVTIEDILEELVGEIVDEYEPPEPEPIIVIDADTAEVDARAHIDELNAQLNIALPEDGDYETVGGFVFSTFGRIPATGDEISHGNLQFKVLDAEDRKINRLRVHVLRNGKDDESAH